MTVIAQEHRLLEVIATEAPKPNATVAAGAEVLLGLISGELSMTAARRRGLQLQGDVVLATRILVP